MYVFFWIIVICVFLSPELGKKFTASGDLRAHFSAGVEGNLSYLVTFLGKYSLSALKVDAVLKVDLVDTRRQTDSLVQNPQVYKRTSTSNEF